jgi:catechol 2,3-dioxygenase-like lactoylglutathione lyase family enzyme
MSGEGVVPAIRVKDTARSLSFYLDVLGFKLERGGPAEMNSAISRGDARLMIEGIADFYSDIYNEAIRGRLGTPPALALYIEAPDLEALYDRVRAADVPIRDALADRPWGQAEFTVEDPDGTWLAFWRSTEAVS